VLGLFLMFLPINTFAQTVSPTPAPAYAVIINQIRGESCCSPGNLKNTRIQLENAMKYELPTTFVLRYDALTDPRYTELILSYQRLHPDLIQTGVMVEIIPSLIQSTNVQFSPTTGQAISKTKCDEATVVSRQSTEGKKNEIPPFDKLRVTKQTRMTGRGDSGMEGQRAISAAEMSEEDTALRQAQGDKVTDEFLREEI
jgi:hypothetical protein